VTAWLTKEVMENVLVNKWTLKRAVKNVSAILKPCPGGKIS
jgi:hypothetical protein